MVGLVINLAFCALMWWRVFQKAGQPGWASIVPIYNVIVLLQVAGKPWWWIFLLMIPVVNLVIFILVSAGVSNAFGKSGGFTVGLVLLSVIFYPILGFGSSQYIGGGGAGMGMPQARAY